MTSIHNPLILKCFAFSGIVFCFMWLVAAAPVSGFVYILPPSAADAAAKTVSDYTNSVLSMRVAATIMIFSSMFYTTWGMLVTMLLKKVEGDFPILFYIQLISLATCVVVILYIGYFWGAASWRAGEIPIEITRMLNDLGWLGVLFTGAPFAVYQVALALVQLMDQREKPVYPRWSAFYSLFVSIFMIEAAGILFFKTGPFSQNGLFVFYIPMILFFVWIFIYSILALRALDRNTVSVRNVGVNA